MKKRGGKTRGQRGVGIKSQELLALAIEVAERDHPCTVRGVAYKLFVDHKIASMSKGEVQKVGRRLLQARERDLIPWDWIVDESRQIEHVATWQNLAEYAEETERGYRKDFWQTQAYTVQVWSEKATVGGVIRPVTEKYGVPFMALHGYGSATVLHNLAAASVREERRQWIVLYVGDHDPSGMHMSEVDIPARVAQYGGNVTVERVALVAEDLHGLPSFPAKEKAADSRYPWYVDRYGAQGWELDAMSPPELRARVEDAIQHYIDPEAWHRMMMVEAAEQATVRHVARAMYPLATGAGG